MSSPVCVPQTSWWNAGSGISGFANRMLHQSAPAFIRATNKPFEPIRHSFQRFAHHSDHFQYAKYAKCSQGLDEMNYRNRAILFGARPLAAALLIVYHTCRKWQGAAVVQIL
jgi:hypothetical protein